MKRNDSTRQFLDNSVQRREMASSSDSAQRKLLFAVVLCVCFMIAEVVGGFLAGSVAIMTDAAHLLSDVTGFGISLFSIWLAKRGSTPELSFGFQRAEILGALLSVLVIWLLTGVLVYEAILRTISIVDGTRDKYVDGKIMFAVSLIGLLCNIVLLRVLGHDHGHSHGGHGHSHGATEPAPKPRMNGYGTISAEEDNHGHSHGGHGHSHGSSDGDEAHGHGHGHGQVRARGNSAIAVENINVSAAYAHAIGDLIQSIGVCIAGGIIWAYPGETYPMVQLADPAATFLFSLLVLYSTMMVLRTSLNVLMEGVPYDVDMLEVVELLSQVDKVVDVHDLHIWSLTLGEPSLSVHIGVEEEGDANKTLRRVQHVLRSKGFVHSTVQIEIVGSRICDVDSCDGNDVEGCDGYALQCEIQKCNDFVVS